MTLETRDGKVAKGLLDKALKGLIILEDIDRMQRFRINHESIHWIESEEDGRLYFFKAGESKMAKYCEI